LPGKPDNIGGETLLVVTTGRDLALRRAMLPERRTGATLGDVQLRWHLPCVAGCSRAQGPSGASLARSSARRTPGATDNTSPRSPQSGGLRPPCSGPARPEHRPAAVSRRSLQACIASLPLLSSLMSKTYLKSDHFNGGGSIVAMPSTKPGSRAASKIITPAPTTTTVAAVATSSSPPSVGSSKRSAASAAWSSTILPPVEPSDLCGSMEFLHSGLDRGAVTRH